MVVMVQTGSVAAVQRSEQKDLIAGRGICSFLKMIRFAGNLIDEESTLGSVTGDHLQN